jgi:hypothetical protein
MLSINVVAGSSKRKNNLKVFTYHELSVATDDFNPSCSVGVGGFRKVYKGFIESIDEVNFFRE